MRSTNTCTNPSSSAPNGEGFLQHEDLAKTLRAFYRARAGMKSEDRDEYIAYLKKNGKHEERFDI